MGIFHTLGKELPERVGWAQEQSRGEGKNAITGNLYPSLSVRNKVI
jgi:hypothetical protein